MKFEEAIRLVKEVAGMSLDWDDAHYDALQMAIKALEQPTSDDCVSRQAVLDKKVLIELPDGQSFYCISPEDVENVPSVTPARKTGKWIYSGSYDEAGMLLCSNCKHEIDVSEGYFKFCPNCGARIGDKK